ncbi:MAG TPA: enoyl-CoA hydratase/isomerase family protein [Thermoanaerobaculia bacterium]|jgi:cyclohexa-1,5-dienecarbonyl-CoA hydratase|nr:enoyl-CoA hydratase/isomerase family protein [Thermoanaerobaculia bacterium]
MSDTVLLARAGRTATLTLNRPPLNILDLATLARLNEAIAGLAADPDLQVVVLRGAGERAFSAGVSVQDHTPDKVRAMLDGLHGAIRGLRDLPAVAVAAVQGHCLGGGMELALGCDLVLATDDARFGQPEIELGCYPPAAAALYPSLLGPARTLELLLTGRTFSCEEAERLGLVTWRVEAGGLDLGIARVLADLTAKSAAVTRLTKRAVSAGRDRPLAAALAETERLYLADLCATADMEEGLTAFLAKRKPVWQHR